MIEVENRFLLTEENKKKLTDGAEFIGERTFTDVYYDDADASVMKRDMWLRSRDGKFEIKVPLNERPVMRRKMNQYKEVEDKEEIRNILNLPQDGNFEEVLTDQGYFPVITIRTTRKKYKKDEFLIAFDITDLGFSVGEIEFTVEDESEMAAASARLRDFAEKEGVEIIPTEGKVLECLKIKQPDLYRTITGAGVV